MTGARWTRITPAAWTALGTAVVLTGLLGWCGIDARRDAETARLRAATELKAVTREAAARDRSAAERLADARAHMTFEKEMTDAVAILPDARPSDRRVALACARLRRQGTADADLPARCRPDR